MAESLGIARFGAPADIARIVAFLASPQSRFCHGAIVDVDGGQTRTLCRWNQPSPSVSNLTCERS